MTTNEDSCFRMGGKKPLHLFVLSDGNGRGGSRSNSEQGQWASKKRSDTTANISKPIDNPGGTYTLVWTKQAWPVSEKDGKLLSSAAHAPTKDFSHPATGAAPESKTLAWSNTKTRGADFLLLQTEYSSHHLGDRPRASPNCARRATLQQQAPHPTDHFG